MKPTPVATEAAFVLPSTMSPRMTWVLIVLLAGLTFTAYLPAIQGGFVWDDDRYAANPILEEPGGLAKIWTLQSAKSPYYREFPLVYTTFWVERRLWGLDPLGFHLVNVALHLMNAIFVWMLLRQLAVPGSWLVAAIFALHPLQVESVAWVSERKNLLCGLFFFSAALAYLRFEDGKGKGWYWGALSLFIGALLSKPVAAVLPVVLLLLRWARGLDIGRRNLIAVLPYFILAFGTGLFTLYVEDGVLGSQSERAEIRMSQLQHILCAARSFWFYPMKLILPVNLAFSYERWKFDAGDFSQWLWVLAAFAAAASIWQLRDRLGRKVLAGIVYYALSIAPLLGFFDLYTFRYAYVADHYQYLAGLGLIAAVVGSLTFIFRTRGGGRIQLFRARRRWLEPVVCLAVLAPLWVATWRQGHDYENPETLWRNTLRKSPNSVLAQNEHAFIQYERGELGEALKQLREALRSSPDDFEMNTNLGRVLAALGRHDEAARYYRRALRIRPNDLMTLQGLKAALDMQAVGPH